MKKNKIQLLSILTFLLLISTGLCAQEESIVLKTSTGDIDGTLTLPDNKTNVSVVLIIAGSGPTDRNGNQESTENNSLKYIAEELRKNGIASVRFDKRGIAKSEDAMTSEKNLRFETYINDVKDWVELLSKDKRFAKIIIAGHSEGSLLGMIAAENNKNVNAFISIAGAGRPADEILKEQMDKAPKDVKDIVFPMIETLKRGDTIGDVPPYFYALFRPSVQPYMISWLKYNPQTKIRNLNVPILILQGLTDVQVKETDANLLAKAQPNAELRLIKNMNHVLKDCDTLDKEKQKPIYSNPDLPLNKEFTGELINFIKKVK